MNIIIYEFYKLIKIFVNLFLLKLKPEEMVHSKVLLGILLITDFIVNYNANVIGIRIFNIINKKQLHIIMPTFYHAMIILGIITLVLWSVIYCSLIYIKKPNRLIQILISLTVVDIILRILLIVGVMVLKYSIFWGLVLFVPIIYWELVVYIFIFANSFDINYIKSGLFTLFYMFLQHNLSEVLVNYIG